MMTSRREILEYVNRADEDDDLEPAVRLGSVMGKPATLRGQLRRGAAVTRPPDLTCDASDVRALVAEGYLSESRGWVRVTLAGKAELGRA